MQATGDEDPRPLTLSETLRDRSTSSESAVAADELEAILNDIIRSAQRTYATIELRPEVFIAYLDERLPADLPHSVALRQRHTTDLYLACACASGDKQAFALFEDRCIKRLDRVLAKVGISADVTAEIKQEIRSRVLVGDGTRAEIVEFSGRGDLRSWVAVMAVRQAVQRRSRARREVSLEEDSVLQETIAPGNPELAHMTQLYREEFKQAFEGALRELPDRERLLLRQHYVDALTIDDLGRLYRVHRSTAARLVERARRLVLEGTRARMTSQLNVQPCEFDSIVRMIWNQLDINLRALHRRRR